MATNKTVAEVQEVEVQEVEVQEEKKPFGMSPAEERAYWAEKVPFKAFKDAGKYKDDIYVGWNGKGYNIQRGVEVMIPRAVREIIYQSMDQEQRTAELIEAKQSAFRAESRKYE